MNIHIFIKETKCCATSKGSMLNYVHARRKTYDCQYSYVYVKIYIYIYIWPTAYCYCYRYRCCAVLSKHLALQEAGERDGLQCRSQATDHKPVIAIA